MITLGRQLDLSTVQDNYSIGLEIGGFPIATLQKCTPPTSELGEFALGVSGANPDQMAPGKPKFGDLTLERVKFQDPTNGWATQLFEAARYRRTGFLFYPVLTLYSPDNFPTESYEAGASWVKSVTMGELDTREANAAILMETIVVRPYHWKKLF